MLIDNHIHIWTDQAPQSAAMLRDMDTHGVDRVCLFAAEPGYTMAEGAEKTAFNTARLQHVLNWCRGTDGRLLPIYWIDPTEGDAIDQVNRALDAGITGFKVICQHFYPGDERALPVYQHIADAGKSILFHSGILWDFGENARYNRPGNWEAMLHVKNLRFALAHISWPWCDELIAVFGKFGAMRTDPFRGNMPNPLYTGQEMYIDMTPGTPPCYREEVIRKVFGVQYELMNDRLLFGTDQLAEEFSAAGLADLRASDAAYFDACGVSKADQQKIFHDNALKFWGIK